MDSSNGKMELISLNTSNLTVELWHCAIFRPVSQIPPYSLNMLTEVLTSMSLKDFFK